MTGSQHLRLNEMLCRKPRAWARKYDHNPSTSLAMAEQRCGSFDSCVPKTSASSVLMGVFGKRLRFSNSVLQPSRRALQHYLPDIDGCKSHFAVNGFGQPLRFPANLDCQLYGGEVIRTKCTRQPRWQLWSPAIRRPFRSPGMGAKWDLHPTLIGVHRRGLTPRCCRRPARGAVGCASRLLRGRPRQSATL
jgi:hypothetical protein